MRRILQQLRLVLSCLPMLLVTVQCKDDAPASDQLDVNGGIPARSDAGSSTAASDAQMRESTASAGATAGTPAEPSDPGAAGAVSAPPPDDGRPTWTGIYNHAFKSCRNGVCHGKVIAGVDMSTQQRAYDSLVDQASDPTRPCAMLGLDRIEPGEPDKSLLYLKLDINAPCGQQMPPGGELPLKARDRVREWILQGAKND